MQSSTAIVSSLLAGLPPRACASDGLNWQQAPAGAPARAIHSPIDRRLLGTVYLPDTLTDGADTLYPADVLYPAIVQQAQQGFAAWQLWPAPKRGEVVRQIGMALRAAKSELAQLVTLEMGKSLQEGLGEVQEMIDICDFAVGLSRQLCGQTMHSERPAHRMYEQYHPLGVVGVITAFNFPVAVWAWNAMIAAVCGNATLWKPSEKTPLTALACQQLIAPVLKANGVPAGVFSLICGGAATGERMAADRNIALVSFTGSCHSGRQVAATVASRLGKSLLELGGNNALIIAPSANLQLAVPALVFGAVGTAGQRCTTTRRAIVHASCYEQVKQALLAAYQRLRTGSPLDEHNHLGPLIDEAAVSAFSQQLAQAQQQGGRLLCGGEVLELHGSRCYVTPAIVEADASLPSLQQETFAPLLYLLRYDGAIDEAIRLQNNVPQGLSSALFTNDLGEAEYFLSQQGSDCGIANINIGTSGAEIGGAFGGEKDTGGGRESGSDAWKAYMRRQTNTINYGKALPLAQGIKFEI